MSRTTSLSLNSDEPREPARGGRGGLAALVVVLALALAGLGFVLYRTMQQLTVAEQRVAELSAKSEEAAALARQAAERAAASEAASRAAAEGRQARGSPDGQRASRRRTRRARTQTPPSEEATSARETAARAQEEAEAIRKRAEAEIGRLEAALGQIAETRRTALGLTMNLGSDHLKFEFDKAELRPEDRELLSRIAGILDDGARLHDLRERAHGRRGLGRLQPEALRAPRAGGPGLPRGGGAVRRRSSPSQGHGKSLPLVKGSSDAARAKNRRVELGIVNMQIRYAR